MIYFIGIASQANLVSHGRIYKNLTTNHDSLHCTIRYYYVPLVLPCPQIEKKRGDDNV